MTLTKWFKDEKIRLVKDMPRGGVICGGITLAQLVRITHAAHCNFDREAFSMRDLQNRAIHVTAVPDHHGAVGTVLVTIAGTPIKGACLHQKKYASFMFWSGTKAYTFVGHCDELDALTKEPGAHVIEDYNSLEGADQ